ncbi:hypothetical protein B0H17DRAFT_540449 [Mycena rosella]|uniref:F-box domain-containing protein n=1 Tax=Mycena rosella TaxID=1033263 RepID=A0AAD7DJ34_MYCRO|nr:hypothetical protein B0H17DRAFT_540449 [Mycena rosella]
MSAALDFPVELQDLIIDHMHGQKQALGTCGLVSKAWLRSSRHHLFGSATLRNHDLDGFLQLLHSPLASFLHSIASLSIDLDDEIESLDKVVNHLPIFPALRHLRLSYIYWGEVSDSTIDAMVQLFGNITKLDLHLVAFNAPRHMATFISRFPRLEEMSLYPAVLQNALEELRTPHVPPTLRTVRFRSDASAPMDSFVTWLHTGESPPAIRALEVGILSVAALPSLGDLLRALGPSLVELDLALMYHVTPADITAHLDFTRNTQLQHLTIHLSLRRFHTSAGGANTPWALLSAARAPISTLTIVLKLDTVDVLDNLDWVYLNRTLQTLPHLAALRRLHFMVHCASGAMDQVEGALRHRLSEDTACGVVDVSVLHTARIFTQGV